MPPREAYPGRALRENDSRREIVRRLQVRLNEVGCGTLVVDGAFGPQTLSSVLLFQTRRGLEADGIVGPATWAALFALPEYVVTDARGSLLRGVLEVARRQVGVRESGGPNRGPEVEKFLASVGLGPGYAWCAAFAYFCFEQSAKALRIPNPAVRTASVHKAFNDAPPAARVLPGDTVDTPPSPGSIYCIDHGHGRGHCGLVLAIRETGILGFEGNTNAGGSREGDGVYRRSRRRAEINLGFVDYSRV